MKTLYLLRHATAASISADYRDYSRELTQVGVLQVKQVANSLQKFAILPAKILTSTSMRTRQTAEGLRLGVDIFYSDSLYNCDAFKIMEEISIIPESVSSLLVVGHAPGIPALTQMLAAAELSESDAIQRLQTGYPTATLARLELDCNWADISPSCCKLTDVIWHQG